MRKLTPLLQVLIISFLCGCTAPDKKTKIPQNADLFETGNVHAVLTHERIKEASSLVASNRNPGLFWTHNDSGDSPRLFLINLQGDVVLEVALQGPAHIDWEDLAIDGSDLYVADTGDNNAVRSAIQIYKITEPQWDSLKIRDTVSVYQVMNLQYANGRRDVEALMIDPGNHALIMVTKREVNCEIYTFPFQENTTPLKLQPIGSLPMTLFNGGDIHLGTGEILLKNYTHIYYWKAGTESAAQRMKAGPDASNPYNEEPQGEAIAWTPTGFITLSELSKSKEQKFYTYLRKMPTSSGSPSTH